MESSYNTTEEVEQLKQDYLKLNRLYNTAAATNSELLEEIDELKHNLMLSDGEKEILINKIKFLEDELDKKKKNISTLEHQIELKNEYIEVISKNFEALARGNESAGAEILRLRDIIDNYAENNGNKGKESKKSCKILKTFIN